MIGPTTLHKLLLDAANASLRQPPNKPIVDFSVRIDLLIARIVELQAVAVMNELDPDRRGEECEECLKYDEDLCMEDPIDGKHVCYDCYEQLAHAKDAITRGGTP